jgi:hypothetical protein
MILRKLIRQIIKESLLVEKYKEGDVMLGSFADAIQDNDEPYEDDEEAYDYDNSKSTSSTSTSPKQKSVNPSSPDVSTQNNSPGATFKDKDLGNSKVQLKEGFEVSKSSEKEITIKDLRNLNSKKYNLQVSDMEVKIKKMFLVDTGRELQFQMTASKGIGFATIERTAVMEDHNKKDIISGFEKGAPKFETTGKDTKGDTATVTFVMVK